MALAALLMVVSFGMVAFAVDLGYIMTVRSQLQRSSDAAALAAAADLIDAGALAGAPNPADEKTSGTATAARFAALNDAGGVDLSVPAGDVTFGRIVGESYPVVIDTGSSTPNAARVRLRRDETANGDLGLYFGFVLGKGQQSLTSQSTAWYEEGILGFHVPEGSTSHCALLPYTMLLSDWEAGFTSGLDEFTHDRDDQTVSAGGDGIREVKLFPNKGIAPGNFGTIDLGNPNNSTADLARQILEGPNASDFSYLPGNLLELAEDGTLQLNGDTGISAGVKDELASIRGMPRIIPLYTSVSGTGNNAQYTIVKFVGVTICDVKLTGGTKYLKIQPSFVACATAVGGGGPSASSFVRRPLALVE